MNGDYSIFNNSMNGVITLSDGVSFISDGQAQHENIIYSNFLKSEDEATILTNDTLTTGDITCTNMNATNITANAETLGTLTVTNLNVDNYGFYVNGFANTISSSLPTTMNNTLKVVGNEFTLENGNINQIGTTSTNTLKTTSINGTLTCQSDLIQTGGNTVLKNITCDNVTMNSNKSITQSGSGISNSLGGTTISDLVVTTSMTFPATVTIPAASQTGDLSFTNGARIIQDLTQAGTNYNTLMYSKLAKLDVTGNVTQSSGTATLLNTTIQGTAEIQGNITQTSGQSVLKAIGCDQVSLNANKDLFFTNGTGKIDQSVSTGTNNMSAITMNANTNFTQAGTGIVSQSGTGTNALKNTSITGTLAVSSTSTFTGNVTCNGTLTMGVNRSITQPTGTTNNQFQATTISNLTCPTATITDLTTTTLAVGNVSNQEIQYLDGATSNLQQQINTINATTSGNSTAITGISYTLGTDTTTIDNNVTITTGKNLLLGSTNVLNSINTLNTNVSTIDISLNTLTNNFNTVTSGITYVGGTTDTTTIDNNVTINKKLMVQGMDIKAEIDALDTSFTTGTINSTNLTTTNLTSTTANITDISSNIIQANTQIKSPNFSISNVRAAETTYNTTAITNPVQTHGIGIGTGDGATLSVFNQGINSWYGTGFVDTCFKVCNAVINHRTGDFLTNGAITCANIVVNTLATITKLLVTNLDVTGYFSASNALTVYPNTMVSSTGGVKTLGLDNILVSTFVINPKYNRTITVNTPVSLYRQFRNHNESTVNYIFTNSIYDTLNSISFTVNRNGSFFSSGVCTYNNTIPNTTIHYEAPASRQSTNYEVYITNAICSFIPSITETVDTYTVYFSVSATSDTSFQSYNFINEEYGYYVNTQQSGTTTTLESGSPGTNFSGFVNSSSLNLSYPSGSSSVVANNIITNVIRNQGALYTGTIYTHTGATIDTETIKTNTLNTLNNNKITTSSKIVANIDAPIMSPGTYFGVWFVDSALTDYKLDRFRFVPCSVANAGSYDDMWVVSVGYKVVLYRNTNYSIVAGSRPWSGSTDFDAQTRTLDNTNGTAFLVLTSNGIYGNANQVGSCKVYYQNNEITWSNFS